MPLINCKVELRLKWTKHCVLASTGTENDDANSDSFNFHYQKHKKSYVPVVTLSAKEMESY